LTFFSYGNEAAFGGLRQKSLLGSSPYVYDHHQNHAWNISSTSWTVQISSY